MELILKKDVENLGFKDDLVVVKNGYGRNYLIPQGFALLATLSAKKMLEETLRQRAFKEEKLIKEARESVEKIKGLELKLPVKSGAEGKLFGSVNRSDISNLLDRNGVSIDKKFINISGGLIKKIGQCTISLRLHRDVNVQLNINIVPEISQQSKKKSSVSKKEDEKES